MLIISLLVKLPKRNSEHRRKDLIILTNSHSKNNDEWFTLYLDLNHAILNLLTILRGNSQAREKKILQITFWSKVL